MTTSTPTPADALITAMHEPGRKNLLDLIRNPLRLTLLCMTWHGSLLLDTQQELTQQRYPELREAKYIDSNSHFGEKLFKSPMSLYGNGI